MPLWRPCHRFRRRRSRNPSACAAHRIPCRCAASTMCGRRATWTSHGRQRRSTRSVQASRPHPRAARARREPARARRRVPRRGGVSPGARLCRRRHPLRSLAWEERRRAGAAHRAGAADPGRRAGQQRHRGDRRPDRLRATRPRGSRQGHRLRRGAHVFRAPHRGLAARSARTLEKPLPMRFVRLALLAAIAACAAIGAAADPPRAAPQAAPAPVPPPPPQPSPQPVSPGNPGAEPPSPPALAPAPGGAGAAAPQIAQQAAAAEANPDWAVTLERIAGSVVSIDVDMVRAFDTEWNTTAQATGFVVDAERGLILTNRHVVTPGPVTSEATFLNREEVQLYPVYRDPVHDFGFYRYDPQKLRFIQPRALGVSPEGPPIGGEPPAIATSEGKQLSIVTGTPAR